MRLRSKEGLPRSSGDVVGYSLLMGADEVGTFRAIKAIRRELADPTIAAHHGRVVKTTGDGILIEFPSIVDAVARAVAIQDGMVARNAGVPEAKRIVFRIGINVGDIIIDESDIHGDGVNIAARLEGLAEPGSICLLKAARDQVCGKLVSDPFADALSFHFGEGAHDREHKFRHAVAGHFADVEKTRSNFEAISASPLRASDPRDARRVAPNQSRQHQRTPARSSSPSLAHARFARSGAT